MMMMILMMMRMMKSKYSSRKQSARAAFYGRPTIKAWRVPTWPHGNLSLVRMVVIIIMITVIIGMFIILLITRPKPAYGRQGLDWIIGPGYSFVVFSTNRGI